MIKDFYMLACFAAVVSRSLAQTICFDGYVMDTYCIDRGTLLDNPAASTLQNPDSHTVHCLVDVDRCAKSGFEILLDTKAGETTFCRAVKFDDASNLKVLKFARENGVCTTCTSSGNVKSGLRIQVQGTIIEPATSSHPAMFSIQSLTTSAGYGNDGCTAAGNPTDPNFVAFCESGAQEPFMLAHGSLMLLGWGLMLPSGVITARCFRHRPNGLWFKIHRPIQASGLVLVIIAWIIALARFDVFVSLSAPFIHGLCGMVVMILGILQPVNAFFRPHPEPPTLARKRWSFLHKGAGYTAVFLAVPTIFLGTGFLPQKTQQAVFRAVYGILICGLVALSIWMRRDKRQHEVVTVQKAEAEMLEDKGAPSPSPSS